MGSNSQAENMAKAMEQATHWPLGEKVPTSAVDRAEKFASGHDFSMSDWDHPELIDTDKIEVKGPWAITHMSDPDIAGFLLCNGVIVGRIYSHCPDIASVLAKLNA